MSTKKTAKKAVKKPGYHHSDKNPYRRNSAYAHGFSLLEKHTDGLPREKLLDLYAKSMGIGKKRASYNLAVIISPRESLTGPRHRSAREGYWCQVEGSHIKLRFS